MGIWIPSTHTESWAWWHTPETPALGVGRNKRIAIAHWAASLVKTASSRFSETDPDSQMRWGETEQSGRTSSVKLQHLGVHTLYAWVWSIHGCIQRVQLLAKHTSSILWLLVVAFTLTLHALLYSQGSWWEVFFLDFIVLRLQSYIESLLNGFTVHLMHYLPG